MTRSTIWTRIDLIYYGLFTTILLSHVSQITTLGTEYNSAVKTTSSRSQAYCSEKYGNLTYIPESQMFDQFPPHLMSLPGAGNSWLRLLIEYATGMNVMVGALAF